MDCATPSGKGAEIRYERGCHDRTGCLYRYRENENESQVTDNDTGWSEEEKVRMREYGYDDMDIIRT